MKKKNEQRKRGRGGRFQRGRDRYGENTRSKNIGQEKGKNEWKSDERGKTEWIGGSSYQGGYERGGFNGTYFKCDEGHRAFECNKIEGSGINFVIKENL